MSQINTESLLRIGNTIEQPSVAVQNPQYNQSSFQGGQYQVGSPQQQIGPSAEQSMFASLAEIAGGVQKGLDTFSQIRSMIEKDTIEKARVKYKSIFTMENATPEQKMKEWDDYSKDVYTPFLGSDWLQELNIDAYMSFGSREAQDKFESDRYEREKTQYFMDPRNANVLADSADGRVQFNEFYANKYRSAKGNAWFQKQSVLDQEFFKNDRLNQALTKLPSAIGSIIAIPSEAELEVAINDGAGADKIKNAYPVFFDFVGGSGNTTREGLQKNLNELLVQKLVTDNPNKYPPYVLQELAKVIPIKAAEVTDSIYKASTQVARAEQRASAAQSIANASITFEGTPNHTNLVSLVNTWASGHTSLGLDKSQVALSFQGLVGQLFKGVNTAASTGIDLPFLAGQDWSSMSPPKQLATIMEVIEGRVGLDSKLRYDLKTVFGIKQDDDVSLPQRIKETVKGLLQTKEFSTAMGDYLAKQKNTLARNGSIIDVLQDPVAINQHTGSSLSVIADELGLSLSAFRSAYIVKKENGKEEPASNINLSNWYKSLDPKEREGLAKRGIDQDTLGTIRELFDSALALELKTINRINSLTDKNDKDTVGEFDMDKLRTGSDNLSSSSKPASKEVSGSLPENIVSGKAYPKKEDRDYLNFVVASSYDKSLILSAPASDFRDGKYIGTDKAILGAVERRSLLPDPTDPNLSLEDKEFWTKFYQQEDNLDILRLETHAIANELVSATFTGIDNPDQITAREQEARKIADQLFNEMITGRSPSIETLSIPQRVRDENGQFTPEAFKGLLQIALFSYYSTKGNAESVKEFGKVAKTAFDNLGNNITRMTPEQILNSDQALYSALAIHLMGRELARNSPSETVSIGNYHQSSVLGLAAMSERTSINDIVKTFTDPKFRENLSLITIYPLILAKRANLGVGAGSESMLMEVGGEIPGQPAMYQTIRDERRRLGIHAFRQPDKEYLEKLKNGDTEDLPALTASNSRIPSDPKWSPDTFIEQLKEAELIDTSDKTLVANAMRNQLLSGSLDPTLLLNDDEVIRLGAQLLYRMNQVMPRAYEYAVGDFLNPQLGYEATAGFLTNRDKTGSFFQFVASSLDLTRASYVGSSSTGNYRIGFSLGSTSAIQISFNKLGLFENVGGNPDNNNNFSVSNLTGVLQKTNGMDMGLKDFRPKVSDIRKPDDVEDGVLFKAGAAILSSEVSDFDFATLLKPWLVETGVLMPNEDPKNFVNRSKVEFKKQPMVVGDRQENAKLAAKQAFLEVMAKKDIPFVEKVKLLQETYDKYLLDPRNKVDIIDPDIEWNTRETGFANIEQLSNDRANPEKMIPSWRWANTTLGGKSMIHISDEFLEGFNPRKGLTKKTEETIRLEKQKWEEKLRKADELMEKAEVKNQ
jgi:hypothetical protein